MSLTAQDLALLESLEKRMDKIEELLKEELEFQHYQDILVRDTKRTISYYRREKEKLEKVYEDKIMKIDANIGIINSNTSMISACEKLEDLKGLACPILK